MEPPQPHVMILPPAVTAAQCFQPDDTCGRHHSHCQRIVIEWDKTQAQYYLESSVTWTGLGTKLAHLPCNNSESLYKFGDGDSAAPMMPF